MKIFEINVRVLSPSLCWRDMVSSTRNYLNYEFLNKLSLLCLRPSDRHHPFIQNEGRFTVYCSIFKIVYRITEYYSKNDIVSVPIHNYDLDWMWFTKIIIEHIEPSITKIIKYPNNCRDIHMDIICNVNLKWS